MIPKPPIQQEMFIRPGVLSTPWVKFFGALEKSLAGAVSDITEIEEVILEGGDEWVEAFEALSSNIHSIKTTTSITTSPDTESYLTLYWMGV